MKSLNFFYIKFVLWTSFKMVNEMTITKVLHVVNVLSN